MHTEDAIAAAPVRRNVPAGPPRRPWRSLAAAGLLALLAACGGGGGSDAPAAEEPQAPPAPAVPARLATLSIETAGHAPIVSREDYLDGAWTLADADGQALAAGDLEIRGRATPPGTTGRSRTACAWRTAPRCWACPPAATGCCWPTTPTRRCFATTSCSR